MQPKFPFQFLLIVFGIALLLAGLFFDKGTAAAIQLQVTATSTPDRLAQPTLPANPSQADQGAYAYWLYCLPCHGDKGQGLTDEFRKTYPPEDQNCWNSGCHGKKHYENGWILPDKVPALIGPGTLSRFSNATALKNFARASMPFQDPGVMTDEQYWQVTAFLLRENGLWDGHAEINESNSAGIIVHPQPTPTPPPVPADEASGRGGSFYVIVFAGLLLLMGFLVARSVMKSKDG